MQSTPTRKRPWTGVTTALFYRNRKPTWLGKLVNHGWARVYALGIPPDFQITLLARRPCSKRMHSTALVVAERNGEKYVVSMLGNSATWVRHVRAAHGKVIIRHGRPRRARLMEVPPDQRAPILKAYLRSATRARPHFPVGCRAPIDAFERIAGEYPVFRIVRPGASQ